MDLHQLADPLFCLRLTTWIASVGILIMTAEFYAIRSEYEPTGLLSWEAGIIGCSHKGRSQLLYWLSPLLDYRGVKVLMAVRAFACVGLLFPSLLSLSCAVVAATSLLITGRTHYGLDGADEMFNVVFITVAICSLGQSQFAMTGGLVFIAFHVALAYLTSGACKLSSPGWATGEHLISVMGTGAFGHRRVYAVLQRRPRLSILLSRGMLFFECAFFLVPFLPSPIVPFALMAGLFFHISIAFIMGLNTFVWAFGCTYPAVYFVSLLISHRIGI